MANQQRPPKRGIALGETALSRVANNVGTVPIMEGFSVDVNGLVPDGEPDFEQCETMGLVLRTAERAIQFALGDYINYLEERFGERASQIIDYSDGWSEKTCKMYSWVASRIDRDRRRMDRLGIKHHLMVAALTPDRQKYWLDRAADGDDGEPWTAARLAKAIKEGEDLAVVGWWVLVLANDEPDQRALMATLEGQGRTVKATNKRARVTAGRSEEDRPETDDAGDDDVGDEATA